MSEPMPLGDGFAPDERALLERLLAELTPLNRTIVSDDMDVAMERIAGAFEGDVIRHRYPSGGEHGSWVVPPSWNVREAYVSDGQRVVASYRDHVLFLAPYSSPFEGWVSRTELLEHTFTLGDFADAFAYQHRVAYDYQKRLRRWEISLPRRVIDRLDRERYFVKVDVDVRAGTLQVLELRVPGQTPAAVALLAHLCHPGQANDGLSGVLAGLALMRRLRAKVHRSTYAMFVMPETIGSAVHVAAQRLSPTQVSSAVFLETMGKGDRLYLKLSRAGDRAIDLAARTIARELPDVGLLGFDEGYGNDEHVFDFPNVAIPSAGVQYHPFAGYHTSRDDASAIDWARFARAVGLTEELLRRLDADRVIRLRHPGPPYLSRYGLYADFSQQPKLYRRISDILRHCDGTRSILEVCEGTGALFDDVLGFFDRLDDAGLLDGDDGRS